MKDLRRRSPRSALVAFGAAALLATSVLVPFSASASAVSLNETDQVTDVPVDPLADTQAEDSVPEPERADALGAEWEQVEDLAWTTVGDSSGFHVFTARMSEGYAWRQIATLGSDAFDTDRWVGNACLSGDQKHLAVVFAPRGFTNDPALFQRGAFAALVDVESGEVTPLTGGYSLAYFNPGCGGDDLVALAQYSDEGATRISTFSSAAPTEPEVVEVSGVVTSVVPGADGPTGVIGRSIVRVGDDGSTQTLVEADGLAFDLAVSPNGDLAYMQHDGEQSQVMVATESDGAEPSSIVQLAEAPLGDVGLSQDANGELYITGNPASVIEELPADVVVVPGAATRSVPSSSGQILLDAPYSRPDQAGASQPEPAVDSSVFVEGLVRHTRHEVDFAFPAESLAASTSGIAGSGDQNRGLLSESSTSPVSEGSKCAVPRNDPAIQAVQPRPAEVEWAVDQAVRQTLDSSFPLPALNGGGRVPAQIMLGILAQESNFWQASKFVVPGVSGNPLVGNYYGVDRNSGDPNAWWQINYDDADCGYGIAQVTTGMEVGGMPYSQQLAIATDYKANIARGLQILIEKWNQTRHGGLVINDGDPQYMENWFYALWAYNTGYYYQGGPDQRWGVGWLNNPINQIYVANRQPFLDGRPADAAHPQDWPYPEKVLGFAAHSVQFLNSVDANPMGDTFNYGAAFNPAWWTSSDLAGGVINRANVKPPMTLFCDASNECNPTNLASPCNRSDYQCWFHKPATWKADCESQCGYEFMKYSLGAAKPAAANSFPANCSASGLPAGALIVDNLPNGTVPVRPGCSPVPTTGSFQFNFPAGPGGKYPAKVDVHQLGSGFNSQFYFSHTRVPNTDAAFGGALDVSGTWNLGQPLTGWAQVYVHMPSHGAWLQQASYAINTGITTVTRSVSQRNYANQWVSLGTLQFGGTPTITLANNTARYSDAEKAEALSGVDDIAWDAVAFVPLAQKPSDFIVALGDSFSSGEGTSAADGSGFLRSTDYGGTKIIDPSGELAESPHRNACHRSTGGWPYGINVPSGITTDNVRTLAAAKDPRIDFQMLACSNAETLNVMRGNTAGAFQQFGELTQLDRGFLDANTTMVTMTIGGNDVGFGPVIETCIKHSLAAAVTHTSPDCRPATPPEAVGFSGTLEGFVDQRLTDLGPNLKTVLNQIHSAAPNARVVLLGYPTLFESGSTCIGVNSDNMAWLNGVAARLNSTITKAAFESGSFVTYQSPQYLFKGKNLCTTGSALNGLIFSLTPGDAPMFQYMGPGPNYGAGTSAQSVHPNATGAELYSSVANATMRMERVDLAASLTGGAATTYYSTFRLHDGGPASMNVSSFGACGNEIRFGLRKDDAARTGVFGQQHTETLGWTAPHSMQTFVSTTTPGSTFLTSGWYALNGRLTAACTGGTGAWQAQLYW